MAMHTLRLCVRRSSPLLLFLLILGAHYPQSARAQYAIPHDAVAGGSAQIYSTNYGMRSTVGQSGTGTTSSQAYNQKAGFWYFRGTTVTGTRDASGNLPTVYELDQNYPNPFNPSTTIRFSLPKRSHVRLRIYDVTGRLVATLVDQVMTQGVHKTVWNAAGFATGLYFYRIEAEGFVQTRKLALLK